MSIIMKISVIILKRRILKEKHHTELVGNMEKVKVVKGIPGFLEAGDILTLEGDSFIFEAETDLDSFFDSRYINMDSITVYENMPEYFVFVVDEAKNIVPSKATSKKVEAALLSKEVIRTPEEINERYAFFADRLGYPFFNGTEGKVVYQNLMWFIEWLYGERQLLK